MKINKIDRWIEENVEKIGFSDYVLDELYRLRIPDIMIYYSEFRYSEETIILFILKFEIGRMKDFYSHNKQKIFSFFKYPETSVILMLFNWELLSSLFLLFAFLEVHEIFLFRSILGIPILFPYFWEEMPPISENSMIV